MKLLINPEILERLTSKALKVIKDDATRCYIDHMKRIAANSNDVGLKYSTFVQEYEFSPPIFLSIMPLNTEATEHYAVFDYKNHAELLANKLSPDGFSQTILTPNFK